jgi:hypothetical protein
VAEPSLQIMVTYVVDEAGQVLAQIERVTIGGGTRVIEGEEHQHPTFTRFHVRMLSPDRTIPDELREAETYEAATELAMAYGARRIEHAAQIDELAKSLKI